MMTAINIDWKRSVYRAMVGTGGIGSGMFFVLDGNHTLGREESRSGRFVNSRDYCKLHIISHYVQALLGRGFQTYLIGRIGDDAIGHSLLAEMQSTGLETRHVQVSWGDQTLFSLCFTYPDGSGGNLTTADSACSRVCRADIDQAVETFTQFSGKGIALAAPEVPLDARAELLRVATQYSFFRVGSFVSGEVQEAWRMGLFGMLDLLALNMDEAGMLCGVDGAGEPPEVVVRAVVAHISRDYPGLQLSLTAGKHGSWCWNGLSLAYQAAFPAVVANTAGAGDAHLAGMIAGHVAGLGLSQAQQLAALAASVSVTSPHTIAPEVGRESMRQLAAAAQAELDADVAVLLASS